VRLALDLDPQELAEQLELGPTDGRLARGDPVDGAVVLADPELAVRRVDGLGKVAEPVLEHRQLADPVRQRGVGPGALLEVAPCLLGKDRPALRDDPVDELGAADLDMAPNRLTARPS
jgi:hypothetical protein